MRPATRHYNVIEDMEEKIKGLRLIAVVLAKGSTGFELEGMVDNEYLRYSLSTMFEVCFEKDHVFKRDIIGDKSTLSIWDCLDRVLEDVAVSPDGRVCSLRLENEKTIYVWSHELKHDNLIVVKRNESIEWFTIG